MNQPQHHHEDNGTAETVVKPQDSVPQHAVLVTIREASMANGQKPPKLPTEKEFDSLAAQYQLVGKSLERSWFDREVVQNSRCESTTDSPVSKLCGVPHVRIFYERVEDDEAPSNNAKYWESLGDKPIKGVRRLVQFFGRLQLNRHEQENESVLTLLNKQGHSQHARLPINKFATLLTFDPDTGLYGRLIRGDAYVVVGEGGSMDASTQARMLTQILEIIFLHKTIYHEWGADFSKVGQSRLLKACEDYKRTNTAISIMRTTITCSDKQDEYPYRGGQLQRASTAKNTKLPVTNRMEEPINECRANTPSVDDNSTDKCSSVISEATKSFKTAATLPCSVDSEQKNSGLSPESVTRFPVLAGKKNLRRSSGVRDFDDDYATKCSTPPCKNHHSSSSVVKWFEKEGSRIVKSFEQDVQYMFPAVDSGHGGESEIIDSTNTPNHADVMQRTEDGHRNKSFSTLKEKGSKSATEPVSDDLFRWRQQAATHRTRTSGKHSIQKDHSGNRTRMVNDSLYPESNLDSVFIDKVGRSQSKISRKSGLTRRTRSVPRKNYSRQTAQASVRRGITSSPSPSPRQLHSVFVDKIETYPSRIGRKSGRTLRTRSVPRNNHSRRRIQANACRDITSSPSPSPRQLDSGFVDKMEATPPRIGRKSGRTRRTRSVSRENHARQTTQANARRDITSSPSPSHPTIPPTSIEFLIPTSSKVEPAVLEVRKNEGEIF